MLEGSMLGAWPDRSDAQHRRLQTRRGGTGQPVAGAGLICLVAMADLRVS